MYDVIVSTNSFGASVVCVALSFSVSKSGSEGGISVWGLFQLLGRRLHPGPRIGPACVGGQSD